MSRRMRVLSAALTGIAAAAAMAFSAAPAQAAVTPVYLYTADTLFECTASGDNGVRGGVFATYSCQNGIAGYSLSVTPARGHAGRGYAYVNTMTLENCQSAGTNGLSGRVFTDFYCQNGFAGYSLMVRG